MIVNKRAPQNSLLKKSKLAGDIKMSVKIE